MTDYGIASTWHGGLGAAAPSDFSTIGPGIEGFIVMFLLALATVLLVRSMVGHLRKVRYSAGPPDPTDGGAPSRDPGDQRPDQP